MGIIEADQIELLMHQYMRYIREGLTDYDYSDVVFQDYSRVLGFYFKAYQEDLIRLHEKFSDTFPKTFSPKTVIRMMERDEIKPKDDKFFYFITINPDESKVTLPEFVTKVQDLLKRSSMFKNVKYQFEQRGKTREELGKGYHVHIITDKIAYLTPKQMQRNIYSTMKNIVGNPMHIDVRKYTQEIVEDKIDYLHGLKWDPDKKDASDLNKAWRQKNALPVL